MAPVTIEQLADSAPARPPRRRTFGRAVAWVVVSTLVVAVMVPTFTAARIWWVARQDDRTHSDVVLVLGASQFDGKPSAVFRARLDHAARLYATGAANKIVTVGGKQPGDRFTEAAAGAAYLKTTGVPADDVVAVEAGSDTYESLAAAAPVMKKHGWGSAILVSDPWHAFRSRQMARDLGIDAVASPTRSGPAVQTRHIELRYAIRETGAFLWYRLFGDSGSKGGPGAL